MVFGFSGGSTPSPSYKRMMIFIDGENLVFNYQTLLKDQLETNDDIIYEKNVFVWHPNTITDIHQYEILRATYYTYVVGDDVKYKDINNKIKSLYFFKDNRSSLPNNLKPCVFKKNKQGTKTKGVDIKMTVDILSNVYHDNLDAVCLIAGDGDYLPIIEEVMRNGKQVYLASFSKGLNPNLLNHVDKYIEIDNVYFKK
jgi:uncharacterized LabA/DUF88 family protein